VGAAVRPSVDTTDRWHGHRTFHIDGSSFSMPDTPELQKHFGQPGNQRAGCGFPGAPILTLVPAGTGFLLQVLAAPLRTPDLAQAAQLHPELVAGDVVVGDRAFGSFAHLALLWRRGLHGVCRAHQKQVVDFRSRRPYNRPGRKRQKGRPSSRWLQRLGCEDQPVEYYQPKERPAWLSAEDYAALAASLVLRELRYKITRPGCRTKAVTLVTTLLDAHQYPAAELATRYGRRWQIESL
jgi:hypothetical protein